MPGKLITLHVTIWISKFQIRHVPTERSPDMDQMVTSGALREEEVEVCENEFSYT